MEGYKRNAGMLRGNALLVYFPHQVFKFGFRLFGRYDARVKCEFKLIEEFS
jgi:hypothetical protein